jgi:hypothetical protein
MNWLERLNDWAKSHFLCSREYEGMNASIFSDELLYYYIEGVTLHQCGEVADVI